MLNNKKKIKFLAVCDCIPGWAAFNNSCYLMFQSSKQFSSAQKACMTYGANLVSVNNNDEMKFLTNYTSSISNKDFWVFYL